MIQLSLRRAQALRHQLALLDLGQPVLPRAALLAAARQLLARRRDGGRPRLLRRLPRPPRRPRPRPRGAPQGRRLHHRRSSSDRRFAHIGGIPVEETTRGARPGASPDVRSRDGDSPRSPASGALNRQAGCATSKTGPRSAAYGAPDKSSPDPQPGPTANDDNRGALSPAVRAPNQPRSARLRGRGAACATDDEEQSARAPTSLSLAR